ncbi:MAG: hypothetical protein PHO32_01645 [Candidatus Cloacimonetes bacterium]|nr:hypothetical protein [Candidatus Cloacimonadota bacterium]
MIAVSVTKTMKELFGRVRYDSNNPEHQQKIKECASLRWHIDNIDVHLHQNRGFFVAVYKGKVIEVFQTNAVTPYITIQQALNIPNAQYNTIIYLKNGVYRVTGFPNRSIARPHIEDHLNAYYFINCQIADEEIRKPLVGQPVDIHGPVAHPDLW